MIQENELRIGNLITRKSFPDTFCTVNWGIIKDIALSHPNDYISIPLTPEILEKCGFEMYNSCYIKKYSYQGELILFSTDTPVAIANNFEPNCFYYAFNHIQHIIKYTHQLQNLYYLLTNTELEIKL